MSRATSASAPAAAVFADPRAPQFAQARAHRTYEALIAAASAAFAADGYDATGTPDIARRARVSVGTFYRYFDDKRQVFIEVSRRHLAAGYARITAGLTPERFVGKARRQTIALTVDVLCAHVAQFSAMQRVFVEMALRDPEVAALRRAFDVQDPGGGGAARPGGGAGGRRQGGAGHRARARAVPVIGASPAITSRR